MWSRAKVDIDRYYTQNNPMVYNWDLYRYLINLGHGYHFKMGSSYHVLCVADGKWYPYIEYNFAAETNTDPLILEKYFVSWKKQSAGIGFIVYPSMFYIIYENDNNIPIMITQNPFGKNYNRYWEQRNEYQLSDTLRDGSNFRVIAGQPQYYVDPPTSIQYEFYRYLPNDESGSTLPPELTINCFFTQEYTYIRYYIDGSSYTDTSTGTNNAYVNIWPPFYFLMRWHSVDPEKLMFHILRMQTDINQNGLYTGDYP